MAVYCDACEKRYSGGKSKCCKADVFVQLRATGTDYFCKECGDNCEVV